MNEIFEKNPDLYDKFKKGKLQVASITVSRDIMNNIHGSKQGMIELLLRDLIKQIPQIIKDLLNKKTKKRLHIYFIIMRND